jgi:hypothetical protein
MDNGYIVRAASGDMDFRRYMRIVEEVIFSAAVLQSPNMLLDFREAVFPKESMAALLDIATAMTKYRLLLQGRIAHVSSPRRTEMYVARNLEALLALKGFNYRCFEDIEAARQWVGQRAPAVQPTGR